MTISIPWNDGPGNIILTYAQDQGNQTVTVTSDTDCIDHDRQQRVTFVVGDGAIRFDVVTASGNLIRTANGNTIRALDGGLGMDEVYTANGNTIRTASGNTVQAHRNSMKVTVMVTQKMTNKRLLVTQNDHIVRTASGHIVRLPNY